MNVLIDTNVYLDDTLNRMPNAISAGKVCDLIDDNKIRGYISANSVTDIYYFAEKKRGNGIARELIRELLHNYSVISVDGETCLSAIDKLIDDFEDALVVVCAESANLDYIITNDKAFLDLDLPVPSIDPAGFLIAYASGRKR